MSDNTNPVSINEVRFNHMILIKAWPDTLGDVQKKSREIHWCFGTGCRAIGSRRGAYLCLPITGAFYGHIK